MPQVVPLSLYVHYPWCLRKCPYCDFNSHQAEQIPESDYIDALLLDLEQDLPLIWGRRIDSVFIGGGTPSLMSAAALDNLLSALRARLNLTSTVEITLEANPGAAEQARFRDYRAAGVNRLSIGVQSFNDRSLTALGRVHDAAAALQAVDSARRAGFENVNLDLMFALPEQTPQQALADLRQAISLAPTHLSYYQLTLEPNTRFYAFPPPLPDDDSAFDMQEQGQHELAAAGYQQYEISAFAQAGRECRHNLNYWRFGDYLGIGAGAHGKITLAEQQTITRYAKQRQPQRYLAARDTSNRYQSQRRLRVDELPLEFMLNALRLHEGFSETLYVQRTGLPFSSIKEALAQALQAEWVTHDAALGQWRTTVRGRQYLNDVLQLFMGEDC